MMGSFEDGKLWGSERGERKTVGGVICSSSFSAEKSFSSLSRTLLGCNRAQYKVLRGRLRQHIHVYQVVLVYYRTHSGYKSCAAREESVVDPNMNVIFHMQLEN